MVQQHIFTEEVPQQNTPVTFLPAGDSSGAAAESLTTLDLTTLPSNHYTATWVQWELLLIHSRLCIIIGWLHNLLIKLIWFSAAPCLCGCCWYWCYTVLHICILLMIFFQLLVAHSPSLSEWENILLTTELLNNTSEVLARHWWTRYQMNPMMPKPLCSWHLTSGDRQLWSQYRLSCLSRWGTFGSKLRLTSVTQAANWGSKFHGM